MSFAGFKKQINKANQYVSEKMGAAEGTKLDDEFVDLERRADAMTTLIGQLVGKTKEYLQPNPAIRAKIYMHMSGQAGSQYPQTEGSLGEAMLKAGHELGPHDSEYASALLDVGSSLVEVSDIRDNMDRQVHENFLLPLHEMEEKELKELALQRKKLQGRRLDFDCKKRKGNKIAVEDVKVAQFKFEESKTICFDQMTKLLGNEVEQIHLLSQLVCSMLEHHKKSVDTLERLFLLLNKRVGKASSRMTKGEDLSGENKPENQPAEQEQDPGNLQASAKGTNPLAKESDGKPKAGKPSCKANIDYKAQKEDQLSFTAGQVIILTGKKDAEWFEGTLDGKIGLFPAKNVEILVDLPSQ